MKIDIVIGNPPYQGNIIEDDTNRSVGKQLFPTFIINAINIANIVSFITPSRWFTGDSVGGTFATLRQFVKDNNHFSEIVHFDDASTIFAGTLIKGGVNYFLYDVAHIGETKFTCLSLNIKTEQVRPLFTDGIGLIIKDEVAIGITNKVVNREFTSLKGIVSATDPFGISGKESNIEKIINSSKEKDVKLLCKQSRSYEIDSIYVTRSRELMNRYKVMISKSAGDPCRDKRIVGKPYVAGPGVVCTDSLITIGSFDNENEAVNLWKYIQTKFVRYMISIIKMSQNTRQAVYELVPIQDFSNGSNIDWDRSLEDIDKQLYTKYSLSEYEISEIEEKVIYIPMS